MKKINHPFLAAVFSIGSLQALGQTYCTPPTGTNGINSYGSASPVITNVTFNTINRTTTTAQKELYVNTGESTTVVKGQSYNFSMTYSMDSWCTDNNTRVWIDWDLNYTFDTGTETVLQSNNSSTGTLTGSILVPTNATTGTTRMRVAMKMGTSCGHTVPDPCLVNDGSLGWHGEVEDYTIVVTPASGIENYDAETHVKIYPNPVQSFFTLEIDNSLFLKNAEFVVFDVLGKEVSKTPVADGAKTFLFENKNLLNGVYSYKLFSEGTAVGTGKFVVEK